MKKETFKKAWDQFLDWSEKELQHTMPETSDAAFFLAVCAAKMAYDCAPDCNQAEQILDDGLKFGHSLSITEEEEQDV